MQQEHLLETRIFNVVRLTYEGRDGTHQRDVIRHPGAVTIVPLVDDDTVCLIRNHRVAVNETLIELPAGTLEPGEDPSETARRELEEETGYRAARIDAIHQFFLSPGILDERMHVFAAHDLHPGPTRLEKGEEIEPLLVPLAEALQMVTDGRIHDAKTMLGLLLYAAQC